MMGETDYLMGLFGRFRYRKLSTVEERLLEEGIEEQSRVTGRRWGSRRLWGRPQAISHPTFTLVAIHGGGTKPCICEIIVLCERDGIVLLPHRKEADLLAFASMLGVDSLKAYATLVILFGSSYDYYVRLGPPKQIRDETYAQGWESMFLNYQQFTVGNQSLWFADGFLYALSLDRQQTPPTLEVTWLCGSFRGATY
jgi:hypothetical protein